MLTGARIAVRSSFVFVAVAGFCSAYAQSGGDEVIRVVVQDARNEAIARSDYFEAVRSAVAEAGKKRGQSGAARVSESVRHDVQSGSVAAPEGTLFCSKVLKPVSLEDNRNGRRNVARLQFVVSDGGRAVSWTSSAREDANPAKLKHREFELIFIPAELFPSFVEERRCFG